MPKKVSRKTSKKVNETKEIEKSKEPTKVELDDDSVEFENMEVEMVDDCDDEYPGAYPHVEIEEIPPMSSPDWHNYVMSRFEKDELVDGNPTVDGLRRVAEKVLGEIMSIISEVVGTPIKDNEFRATIKVQIHFADNKVFTGCADAFSGNAEKEFARHAVALAETRAEGRCLKRALRLKRVVSAEEMVDDSKIEYIHERSEDDSNDQQLIFIDVISKKGNINPKLLIQKDYPNVNKMKELSRDEARDVCAKLAEYKRNPDNIPEDILGYQKWEE